MAIKLSLFILNTLVNPLEIAVAVLEFPVKKATSPKHSYYFSNLIEFLLIMSPS